MKEYLFVYGTLMADFDSAMAKFLKQRAVFVGKASVSGVLLDLGHYPALHWNEHADGTVKGHVFELPAPKPLLDTLDAYEGIDPGRPGEAEYRRERHPAKTETGQLDCWMYVFNGDRAGLGVIPTGYYPDFAHTNPAHRRFMGTG